MEAEFLEKPTLTALSYHLYDEDVALDTLLDMCKKGQVAIRDIFVSTITEQFLQYVATLQEKDYEEISSFIVLAATLLEIKSAELLPKVEYEDLGDDGLSESELFFLRAEEYAKYREAAEKLREYEVLNRFYHEPMFGEDDYKLVIKDFSLEKLISAFSRLLERAEFEEDKTVEKTIVKERFSVAERISDLVEVIRAFRVVKLSSLFEKDFSKLEIINTFLALLEITKQQIATIEQDDDNEDITIRHTPLTDKFDEEKQEELLKDADEYN